MDTSNLAPEAGERQDFQAPPELNPSAKRLLLSAHLNLISKKLRRGLCVEAGEISALLPLTVPDGWRPDGNAPMIDSGDEDWAQRVAGATR